MVVIPVPLDTSLRGEPRARAIVSDACDSTGVGKDEKGGGDDDGDLEQTFKTSFFQKAMGALDPKTLMRACLSPKHASSIQHFWAFSFPMTQDMSRAAVQGRTKSVCQDWAPSYF